MLGSPVRPAVAFATTHSQRFASFFLGLSELEVADTASTRARHILEIMICRGLKGNGQKWVQVSVACR